MLRVWGSRVPNAEVAGATLMALGCNGPELSLNLMLALMGMLGLGMLGLGMYRAPGLGYAALLSCVDCRFFRPVLGWRVASQYTHTLSSFIRGPVPFRPKALQPPNQPSSRTFGECLGFRA